MEFGVQRKAASVFPEGVGGGVATGHSAGLWTISLAVFGIEYSHCGLPEHPYPIVLLYSHI